MDDDKIKYLFDNFDPELSSSFQFMTRLKRNMEAVEIVKQHNTALKKRNKLAVAIAAISGFAMGVILTLLFPMISNWVSMLDVSIPNLQINGLTVDCGYVAWMIVMAGTSVITSLNVYEIALARRS